MKCMKLCLLLTVLSSSQISLAQSPENLARKQAKQITESVREVA